MTTYRPQSWPKHFHPADQVARAVGVAAEGGGGQVTALKHYLRARRVRRHRRAADELALVIFWSELRRAER